MSYFDDQEDAWLDGGCEGDITDINPDEYCADKLDGREDKEIKCVECKENFIFGVGEQDFFETKNFKNPKRCKKCRLSRVL